MNRPIIASGVEKRNDRVCVGIDGRDVGAFAPVAVEAGQSEVLEGRGPTVLCCNHMIRFVSHEKSFRKKAVFAMVSGSLSDLIAQSVGDLAHEADGRCCQARALMSAKR
jgi:hypothetical protein